jgi:ubiquinone/menaquinone biosynthesis C-methylase UbiE
MKRHFVENIRRNYDRLAADYSAHIFEELRNKPVDQELLTRFAKDTRGNGEVCDMACGPGHIARFLHQAQVSVFGLDLSSKMVEEARRLSPSIPFRLGDMLALDLPDQSLAGIATMYGIVNLPGYSLPTAFREMWRVLKPGGLLLMSFHIGDQEVAVPELWGNPVTMPFYFLDPAKIRRMLEETGFDIEETVERDPYPDIEFQSRRAYVFARKPLA